MKLRGLLAGIPLAVLVAVLAHAAAFGFDHAPGAGSATGLIVTLAAGLALLLLSVFFGAAVGFDTGSLAAYNRRGFSVLGLAALAAGAFVAIELSEGHIGGGGILRALIAVLPLAAAVAYLGRRAQRALARAGGSFAEFARCIARGGIAGFVRCIANRIAGRRPASLRARSGRAPPSFA